MKTPVQKSMIFLGLNGVLSFLRTILVCIGVNKQNPGIFCAKQQEKGGTKGIRYPLTGLFLFILNILNMRFPTIMELMGKYQK